MPHIYTHTHDPDAVVMGQISLSLWPDESERAELRELTVSLRERLHFLLLLNENIAFIYIEFTVKTVRLQNQYRNNIFKRFPFVSQPFRDYRTWIDGKVSLFFGVCEGVWFGRWVPWRDFTHLTGKHSFTSLIYTINHLLISSVEIWL